MPKHFLAHFRVHSLRKQHARTRVAECVEGSPDYFRLLREGSGVNAPDALTFGP